MVAALIVLAFAGLEVAAPPELSDGYTIRSVEVLRWSDFTRLPRLGGNFGSETLELDGGTELYIRLNGDPSRIYWLDDFNPSAPGPGGVVPLIAVLEDGGLAQWVSGVWVQGSVLEPVPSPVGGDVSGRWTAAGVWFLVGLGLWAVVIRTVWQRSVML